MLIVNYVAVYTQQVIPEVTTTVAPSSTKWWPHPTPHGYPNPARIPAAAGQRGPWGHWHAHPPPVATTTALITQVPVTANATAITATATAAATSKKHWWNN